jgi:hypothetical protein
LEFAFCYQLEHAKSVLKYRTQAVKVPFGGYHIYPDFLIWDKNALPYFREVKSFRFADTSRSLEKSRNVARLAERIGSHHQVVTERDLWQGNEKRNRMMAYDRGGKRSPSELLLIELIKVVLTLSPSCRTASQIRKELKQRGLPSYLIEAALFNDYLKCDMSRLISESTLLEVMQ